MELISSVGPVQGGTVLRRNSQDWLSETTARGKAGEV